MITTKLPIHEITVEFTPHQGGTISSNLLEGDEPPDPLYKAAIDSLESFILAAAVAGVDIESPAFLEAIETTVETIDHVYN